MHERAAEFGELARDRYDLDVEVLEFDAGTETAAAAADAVGCETAAIASTIVAALSGGDLVAAITSGANRLDLDALADRFEATSASMAEPDRIRDALGWSIGGVPPICHDETVPTVMDPTLESFDAVYAAAGTPSAVFAVDPATLAALANATVVDLTE